MIPANTYIQSRQIKNAGERCDNTNSPTIQATVNLAEEGRQMTSVLPKASAKQFLLLSAIAKSPGITGPDLRQTVMDRGVQMNTGSFFEITRRMIDRDWIIRTRRGVCSYYELTDGGKKEIASVVSFYSA